MEITPESNYEEKIYDLLKSLMDNEGKGQSSMELVIGDISYKLERNK